ncbi:MAG: YgaP family membrane protein [Nitrospinales bacterium]
MTRNIGKNERIIRVVAGVVLIITGIILSGTTGTIIAVLGLIPVITGAVGNCPVYSLAKINTCVSKNLKITNQH